MCRIFFPIYTIQEKCRLNAKEVFSEWSQSHKEHSFPDNQFSTYSSPAVVVHLSKISFAKQLCSSLKENYLKLHSTFFFLKPGHNTWKLSHQLAALQTFCLVQPQPKQYKAAPTFCEIWASLHLEKSIRSSLNLLRLVKLYWFHNLYWMISKTILWMPH